MEDIIANIVETATGSIDPGTETAEAVTEEKTFTQYELDKIIKERIGKEKIKTQQQFEKLEKEFQQRELDLHVKQSLKEKDLPSEIIDVLRYDDAETFDSNLKIIENIITDIKLRLSAGTPQGGGSAGHYAAADTDKRIRDAMKI